MGTAVLFRDCDEDESLRRLELLDRHPVTARISPEILTFTAIPGGHVDLTAEGEIAPRNAQGRAAAAILKHAAEMIGVLEAAVVALAKESGNEKVREHGAAVAEQVAEAAAAAFEAVFDWSPGGAH